MRKEQRAEIFTAGECFLEICASPSFDHRATEPKRGVSCYAETAKRLKGALSSFVVIRSGLREVASDGMETKVKVGGKEEQNLQRLYNKAMIWSWPKFPYVKDQLCCMLRLESSSNPYVWLGIDSEHDETFS